MDSNLKTERIMESGLYKVSDYRYERKFFITELSQYQVEHIVKHHSSIFSELFPQRFINNIYFDSFNLINLNDSVEGATNRAKVRIRWYGDLFGYIETPVLEIKIKKGLLGKKISLPIEAFILNEDTNLSEILSLNKDLQDTFIFDIKTLRPVLLNRYSRNYLQSCNGYYRITIDSEQSFYEVYERNISYQNKMEDNNSIILELKYAQKHDLKANDISAEFPFRVTKSSKYVNGIQKFFQFHF